MIRKYLAFYYTLFLCLLYLSCVISKGLKKSASITENEQTRKNEATPKYESQLHTLINENSQVVISHIDEAENYLMSNMQCGTDEANIKIKILIDDWPEQSHWTMDEYSNNNLTGMSHPFSLVNETYLENFYLMAGIFRFTMYDDRGDGLCPIPLSGYCGSYEISVNDIVAGKGLSFRFTQDRIFTICTTDDQCDNKNACTTDSCYNNLFVHKKLMCSEYGRNNVTVLIKTDYAPFETTWNVRDLNNNVILYSGGDYLEKEHLYIDSFCLSLGKYAFNMFDSWADGIYRDEAQTSSCG